MTWRLARVVCMTLTLCALLTTGESSPLLGEENKLQQAARQHWAYQPITRPEIPAVIDKNWVKNPIDQFILAKLESKGWKPARPALPHQMVRRLYLGVIGLPPKPSEQKDYLDRPSSKLLDIVVDDLLRSPAYGERWGRHWLDVVRYADTNGYERDSAKPYAWRYRDYVIRAFNEDKPFDRFIVEQLAGDLVKDSSISSLIATGYFLLGAWDDAPTDAKKDRYEQLDDFVTTTGQSFLGISLGCARCHDHKMDAFTQQDYYGMAAIFSPIERPIVRGREVAIPATLSPRSSDVNQDAAEPTNRVSRSEVKTGKKTGKKTDITSPRKSNDAQPADLARAEEPGKDSEEPARGSMSPAMSLPETFGDDDESEPTSTVPLAYIPKITVTPEPVFVLARGEPGLPEKKAVAAIPASLARGGEPSLKMTEDLKHDRLALAEWIASPKNPLTARVIVNRVWQFHFGVGLVRTPDDFGLAGDPPTHPELLDWLADWFVNDAHWKLKELHRLILTSNTYRMSQRVDPAYVESDPENLLLSHFPRRRLDAEVIHDSMLAVSKQLNRRMFGPPTFPYIDAQTLMSHRYAASGWERFDEKEASRRAIYACSKRTLPVPFFETFDACPSSQSVPVRLTTTTSVQALTLLNGELVNRQAKYFADRLIMEAGSDPRAVIDLAFRLALSRPPSEIEAKSMLEFLNVETAARIEEAPKTLPLSQTDAYHQAVIQFCRAIFNLDEFLCSE